MDGQMEEEIYEQVDNYTETMLIYKCLICYYNMVTKLLFFTVSLIQTILICK